MPLIDKELTKEFITKTLRPDRLISAMVFDLKEKGKEIAKQLPYKEYSSLDEFFARHDAGNSALILLEGRNIRSGNIFTLKKCILQDLKVLLLNDTSKLPLFYDKIEKKYMEIYKKKTAILNPLCIACQVVRESSGNHIKIGFSTLIIKHIACRSELTGKIVYSEEGVNLAHSKGITELDHLLKENICIYYVGTR